MCKVCIALGKNSLCSGLNGRMAAVVISTEETFDLIDSAVLSDDTERKRGKTRNQSS